MRVNSGSDLQAQQMASPASFIGVATASSATSLTATGTPFTASSGTNTGLAGKIVVASANSSGAGATVFGNIISNTTSVLTVDAWYTVTSGLPAAGSTPNATANFAVVPGVAPGFWMALTTDATAPAATDTSLASELSGSGWTRAQATYAHTTGASTYTLVKTFTSADGTARTINKMAIFNAASNAGTPAQMVFESAVPSPPVLVSGDTVTITETVTI